MQDTIEKIEQDETLSTDQKIARIEALIADIRKRAEDENLPLESQQGHLLVAAEGALKRLQSGA